MTGMCTPVECRLGNKVVKRTDFTGVVMKESLVQEINKSLGTVTVRNLQWKSRKKETPVE